MSSSASSVSLARPRAAAARVDETRLWIGLTDGREIYVRTAGGQFFNLLRSPAQPLLAIGEEGTLKTLSLRLRARRKAGKTGRRVQ